MQSCAGGEACTTCRASSATASRRSPPPPHCESQTCSSRRPRRSRRSPVRYRSSSRPTTPSNQVAGGVDEGHSALASWLQAQRPFAVLGNSSGVSKRAAAWRAPPRRAAVPPARHARAGVAEGRPEGPAQLQLERVPGPPRAGPWGLPAEESETRPSERRPALRAERRQLVREEAPAAVRAPERERERGPEQEPAQTEEA